MGKTLWTDADAGEAIRVRGVWDNDAEARFIGEEVEDLQRKGHPLGEIAILVRTGAQTRAFEERFITLGMPYRVVGGPRFYERREIRDALAYLRVIQSPDDDLAFERIINVPKRGLGNKALQTLHTAARGADTSLMRAAMRLVDTEELRPQARKAMRGLLEAFARWRRLVQEVSHTELVQTVLEESGYTEMWQQDTSAEAPGRLENLKELVAAMGEFDSLAGFLEHVSLVMESTEAEDADMVTVMTLHGAKGLEFDTVFLAGWEEGLFPNQRAMDEHGLKGLEEERRLAYVGLTRARRRAIVTFCANRRMYGSFNAAIPSRFVDELPAEHTSVESDPGLYGSGAAGRQQGPYAGGFAEPSARWSPGMARARARQGESTQFIEGTAEVIDSAPGSYAKGDRVFHRKFGYGTVDQAEGERLTIAFDHSGPKKVMASFVVPAEKAG
jgi:DNA helicase-2/ATP-dependent DNA helicase PcrA